MSQAYNLTWHDYYIIQASTLTPEERNRIQVAARQHADQTLLVDSTVPVGEVAVAGHRTTLGLPTWSKQLTEAGYQGSLSPSGYGNGLGKSS